MGQRAGLVKDDGIGVGQSLQILAALDRDMVAAALTHGGQHGQRHRQLYVFVITVNKKDSTEEGAEE